MSYSQNALSGNSPETRQFSVTFIDKGIEIRSFTLENESHTVFINEIKEWLEKQKDIQHFTTSIKAPSNITMGLILDLKTILRESNVLKISYTEK